MSETEPTDEFAELAARLTRLDNVDDRDQETGTLRKLFDEVELRKLPDDELLDTSGVLSHVVESEETIGHVLMIEWDDIDDVMRPIRTANRMPGISVLLRSSARSYHLFNLSVRTRDEQLLDALRKDGDVWQARWAARRGYFVLRILPKIRHESRDVYKDGPQPVAVFSRESEFRQSTPHYELLLDMAREGGLSDLETDLIRAREDQQFAGSSLKVEHYQTVTDEAKEVLG